MVSPKCSKCNKPKNGHDARTCGRQNVKNCSARLTAPKLPSESKENQKLGTKSIGEAAAQMKEKNPLCETCGHHKRKETHDRNYSKHIHVISCDFCQSKVKAHFAAEKTFPIKIVDCPNLAAERKTGTKTDFDKMERTYRKILAAHSEEDFLEAVKTFSLIDNRNRSGIFKHKSTEELVRMFQNARADLLARFPSAQFSSSDNNQQGKDLCEVNSGKQIELKSGKYKTDANSGVGIIAEITGIPHLAEILSPEERRNNFNQGSVEKSKNRTMRNLAEAFTQIGEENKKHVFRYLCAVSYGYTKEEEIHRFFEHVNKEGNISDLDLPLQLRFKPDGHLEEYGERFNPYGSFIFSVVDDADGRPYLKVEQENLDTKTGETVVLTGRIYPHYKNSRKNQPASDWVSSPSFHTWVSSTSSDA